jgi:hypothetical protein
MNKTPFGLFRRSRALFCAWCTGTTICAWSDPMPNVRADDAATAARIELLALRAAIPESAAVRSNACRLSREGPF